MTREDLITKIAESAEITKKVADLVLKAILEEVTSSLAKEEKVTLVGFGTFQISNRSKRSGVNPRTKQKITIDARKVPVFRAGKSLKEAVK